MKKTAKRFLVTLMAVSIVLALLPAVTASAAPVYSATIGNVTVSGRVGMAMSVTAQIRMAVTIDDPDNPPLGATLTAIGIEVNDWFTPALPEGVIAYTEKSGMGSSPLFEIVFSGTPTAASTAVIGTITIPASANNIGIDIIVTPNPNAKFNITAAPPPTPSGGGGGGGGQPQGVTFTETPVGAITDNNSNATLTLNGNFADFNAVSLNGVNLTHTPSGTPGIYYLSGYPGFSGNIGEVRSGSTIVILYNTFLAFLNDGNHTLKVSFLNASIDPNNPYATPETSFVLSRTTARSPKTGDDTNAAVWYALLITSILGIAGVVVYNRPKNVKINDDHSK